MPFGQRSPRGIQLTQTRIVDLVAIHDDVVSKRDPLALGQSRRLGDQDAGGTDQPTDRMRVIRRQLAVRQLEDVRTDVLHLLGARHSTAHEAADRPARLVVERGELRGGQRHRTPLTCRRLHLSMSETARS